MKSAILICISLLYTLMLLSCEEEKQKKKTCDPENSQCSEAQLCLYNHAEEKYFIPHAKTAEKPGASEKIFSASEDCLCGLNANY